MSRGVGRAFHRFPTDLRSGFGTKVRESGGAYAVDFDVTNLTPDQLAALKGPPGATTVAGLTDATTPLKSLNVATTAAQRQAIGINDGLGRVIGDASVMTVTDSGGTQLNVPDAFALKQSLVRKLDVSSAGQGASLGMTLARAGGTQYQASAVAVLATDDFTTAAKSSAKTGVYGLRAGSLISAMEIGPQTVKHLPAPGLGNPNVYGSAVVLATTQFEANAEFVGSFNLICNKGSTQAHGSADKVALFASATGQAGTTDIWSFNTIVQQDPNSGDYTSMGYELDCNNQNKHYGDAFGPAGAVGTTNFYGLLITGVGSFRKSAAIAITDVVNGAWNRGLVIITGAISATGSSFQDICNGHTASIDILGSPTYGIRQTSNTIKNWLNGFNIIGGDGVVDPAARLHIEGGPLGGAAGNSLELFRFAGEAGANRTFRTGMRFTLIRQVNGADGNSTYVRMQNYIDNTLNDYLDFRNGGTVFGNANGDALTINSDRKMFVARPRRFVDLTGYPIYADNASATAGGLASGEEYRTAAGVQMVRT